MLLGISGMYFTNALYESPPDEAPATLDGGGAPTGPASYGATDSNATQTVSPAVQMLSAADLAAAQKPSGELTMDEMVDQLEVDDQPCMPPRFEPWRLCERIIANCAAVFVWVGVWDQVCGAASNIVLPARADHSLTAPPAWRRTDRHECVATAVQLQCLWPLL